MTGSNQHSVRDTIMDCFPSHGWRWKDDPSTFTQTSEHDPECRRCKAEAALDGLFEQLQAAPKLSHCAYCGVAFDWDGKGDSCPGCKRANDLQEQYEYVARERKECAIAYSLAAKERAELKEQNEILDKQRLKWERLAMDRGFALEGAQEQFEALHRLAQNTRDSWLLWTEGVDDAHLSHSCEELDNWLVQHDGPAMARRDVSGGLSYPAERPS